LLDLKAKYSTYLSICCLLSLLSGKKLCMAQDINGPRLLKLNYQILSTPTLAVDENGNAVPFREDEPARVLNFQLRFPLLLAKETKILGEISYRNELLSAFYHPDNRDANILGSSEADWGDGMPLQQSGFGILLLHDLSRLYKLKAQFNFSSSSTQFFSNSPEAHRYKFAAVIERERRNKTWGIGININYHDRLAIIPLLTYKEKLNRNWTLDMLLPVKANLIRSLPNNDHIILGFRGSAGSYFLDSEQLIPDALYQRLTLHGYVGYERMLSKYIGFGLDAGVNIPLRNRIRSWEDRTVVLHNFHDRVSPHIGARLFFAICSD
ncbi:MAG: hypothetical protein AAF696_13270, partial [Bacteroidota bacterium]